MKRLIKQLFPRPLVSAMKMVRSKIEDSINSKKTEGEIFTDIYKRKKWGSVDDRPFCSGDGTIKEHIISPYVSAINDYIRSLGRGSVVVDLGCGDMFIGRNIAPFCDTYIGVDVVPDLISWHQARGYGKNIYFESLDISKDELPNGDICLIRQVLQHLSNEKISEILSRLDKYKVIFVTEHHPWGDQNIVPNVDMVTGSGTRFTYNSGVYIDKAPFIDLLSARSIERYLQVPVDKSSTSTESGVICTYKIE